MAVQNDSDVYFRRIVRRILVSALLVFVFLTFLIWRIDNPRAERFRMAVIDKVVPTLEWAITPLISCVEYDCRCAKLFKDLSTKSGTSP